MKILVTSIVDVKHSMHLPIHEYINHLAEKHELHVFSFQDWWKAKWNKMATISNPNVKINYLTRRKISPVLQELLPVSLILYLIKRRTFDVHLNYSDLTTGFVAAVMLKALTRGETVFVIADDLAALVGESPQIPGPARRIASLLASTIVQANIRVSKRVCLVTRGLRDTYRVDQSKAVLLPNAVNTDAFRPMEADDIRERYSLRDCFVVGYAGVLREWVDVHLMLSTLSHLDSRFKLLVVGEEGKNRELREFVKTYGVENRVVFAGSVPYDMVPRFINAMDVCLIPFKINKIAHNALPMKLFEYMACGKPTISVPLRGVEEAVGNRVIYASDAKQMADAIAWLSRDIAKATKLGKMGRDYVQDNFSWKTVCKTLEEILLKHSGA